MSGAGPSNNPHPSAAEEKESLRANSAIPIPSYEEATSSRAASEYGEPNDAPGTASGMAESSNLLSGYRPPTVESARNSMDSSFLSDYESARSSEESLQREMIQMDIEEAEEGTRRNPFQKRFGWSISLPRNPFRGWTWRWRPRWTWGRPRMPDMSFCTTEAAIVPIARLMIVVLAFVMVYGLFATGILNYPNRLANDYIIPQRLRNYATESLDFANIDHWMNYLSSFNHVAGTKGDLVLAKYVQQKLGSFGFETERVEFPVYMNFPKPGGRRVWMDNPKWEAKLEERKIDKEYDNTAVYHGLSKTGTAKGPLVYANHGTREDFARLEQLGIKVQGAIVMMRHGGKGTNDGQKVLAAQEKGAVGCLIFTDPETDGFGWPIDAVRRASVGLRNWVPGDPLTPGYESSVNLKANPHKGRTLAIVKIPSLPLSWGDAKPLLKALKGIGHPVDESWKTVVPEVYTGDPAKSPVINLQNDQVEKQSHPIWNVAGRIQGRDPHESRLIIGTHRDAWCYGASDPNSGTAVMLEVARVIGSMKDFGWKPLRTIEFYSWDATEYNLMGSTEFVESTRSHTLNAMAYINVASAVTGTTFSAAGSPSFTSALASILPLIKDPSNPNSTIQELWGSFEDHPLPGLGGAGDYSAFQNHLGIPSLDLTFTGPAPSGSCYDTYGWIKHQDEFLQYHVSMAKILILLILDLADTAVAPLSMAHYDRALQRWTSELETWLPETARGKVDLAPLKAAVKRAGDHIRAFDGANGDWLVRDGNGFYKTMDDWSAGLRRARTARMSYFDRHLCYEWTSEEYDFRPGKIGRQWFRNMVMGPQEWGGDEPSYFPWIRDAVEKEDWKAAQKYVAKVSELIERAARKLLDEDQPSPPPSA